jgi:hypothetical protein
VLKLDSSLSREINKHFSASVGLPLYFARGASTTDNAAVPTSTGMGNAYLGFGFSHPGGAVNYSSSLMISVPTGDRGKGLSTGRVTVDWSNDFDRSFSTVTPFASIGIANTVSDTSFFIRPFSSNGLVGHAEGGASIEVAPKLTLEGSVYVVRASGDQRIVSRIVKGGPAAPSPPGKGKGAFKTGGNAIVDASDADDRGFSASLAVQANSALDLLAGYSRSSAYEINSLFFGIHYSIVR